MEIKAYYAGHVLGAAMFQVKVGDQSVVYTVSQSQLLVLCENAFLLDLLISAVKLV